MGGRVALIVVPRGVGGRAEGRKGEGQHGWWAKVMFHRRNARVTRWRRRRGGRRDVNRHGHGNNDIASGTLAAGKQRIRVRFACCAAGASWRSAIVFRRAEGSATLLWLPRPLPHALCATSSMW